MSKPKAKAKPEGDPEPLGTITCAVCGGLILTVPQRVVDSFASGRWLCARDECHAKAGAPAS